MKITFVTFLKNIIYIFWFSNKIIIIFLEFTSFYKHTQKKKKKSVSYIFLKSVVTSSIISTQKNRHIHERWMDVFIGRSINPNLPNPNNHFTQDNKTLLWALVSQGMSLKFKATWGPLIAK